MIREKDIQKYTNVREAVEGDYYDRIAEVFANPRYHDSSQELPTENVYDIREFGAVPDLEFLSTQAINDAVSAAAETKGTVLVAGGSFRSGTITLKSNVTLFIAEDAAIYGSRNPETYDAALLVARDAENIRLTGGGKLCGEGEYFVGIPDRSEKHLYPELEADWETPILTKEGSPDFVNVQYLRKLSRARIRGLKMPWDRQKLVLLYNCKNVAFDNFVLESSPEWTLCLTECEDVTVNRLIINDNRHVANADGIDVNGSSNVTIKNSFIAASDDGIVLKNTSGKKMSNIQVYDCEVQSVANCFKIGTETSSDIANVTVNRCHFFLPDIYPGANSGISIESADGAAVTNIKIMDIVMEHVQCPVFISANNRMRFDAYKAEWSGVVDNVWIENVAATDVEAPSCITGASDEVTDTKDWTIVKPADHRTYVKNVTIKNFKAVYRDSTQNLSSRMACENTLDGKPTYDEIVTDAKLYPTAREYPEHNRLGDVPAYGFYVRHAKNVVFENVQITPRSTETRKEYVHVPEK